HARRDAPARDVRPSCSFAAAVHNRRLRAGTRWLGALAGRACRSVSAGRSPCSARASIRRPNANAQALKHCQPTRERAGVTEAAEEGSGARQDGQGKEAETEEKDRTREVATAGSTKRRAALPQFAPFWVLRVTLVSLA